LASRHGSGGHSKRQPRGSEPSLEPIPPPDRGVILVDTSVWVEHLRCGLPRLAALLQEGEVLIHP